MKGVYRGGEGGGGEAAVTKHVMFTKKVADGKSSWWLSWRVKAMFTKINDAQDRPVLMPIDNCNPYPHHLGCPRSAVAVACLRSAFGVWRCPVIQPVWSVAMFF